jgi:hypothetical protein
MPTKIIVSGVYALYFENSNNKYYIGKSYNLYGRYEQHCKNLRCGVHHSISLQNAYNKYKVYPTLAVLKTDTSKTLSEWEIHYIKEFDSFKNGYNQTGGGDGAGYGYTGSSAILQEEDYLCVFFMLTRTNMRKTDIAKELGISPHIVTSISLGTSHAHLKDIYPEDYTIMLNKFGRHETAYKHTKDTYISILKDLANTDDRLVDIAERNNVSDGVVEDISRGATHKYLKESYPKEYALMLEKKKYRRSMSGDRLKGYPPVMSPEGIVYYIDSNAKAFALEHGLHQGHFAELLVGTAKSHKGWVLASIG